MVLSARVAMSDDLEQVVGLTAAHRRRLASWAPSWWRASAAADDLHAFWLKQLIESDDAVVRVVDDSGRVVGCAVSMPQPAQWFVDDVAVVDDSRWGDAGVELLNSVAERPALTCIPHAHRAMAEAGKAAHLDEASSYWSKPTDAAEPAAPPPSVFGPSGLLPSPAAPSPPHTFGNLDPRRPGALVVSDGRGGLAIGSKPLAPPPVYEVGGTITVVDRVVGSDREALLRWAVAAARTRGDVLLTVVAGDDDVELQDLLAGAGFERTVDVFRWTD